VNGLAGIVAIHMALHGIGYDEKGLEVPGKKQDLEPQRTLRKR
jgi:hypothetical protein